MYFYHSCNQLNDTTNFLNLPLRLLAHVARLDDNGHVRQTALTQDLGVAQREKVEDDGAVGRRVAVQVLVARFLGDQGPEL